MNDIASTGDNAPPGLSKDNIAAVQAARTELAQAIVGRYDEASSMILLRDLLTAYEVLAARMAWLAASHAELHAQVLSMPREYGS